MALSVAYERRDSYTDDAANLSRRLIGNENTARLERLYFKVEDKKARILYSLTGDKKSPFDNSQIEVPNIPTAPDPQGEVVPATAESATPLATATLEPPKPAPLVLPEIADLGVPLEEGEGVWRTDGLPHTSADDPLMVKAVVRPDPSRPDASVAVLLLDKRRIRLHITGGTRSPGGDRGVEGPGKVADEDLPNLLVAWNGGFQGSHASFGTYADGQVYRPLRDGYASVATTSDGTILMGEWGRTLSWNDDMTAVRQNGALLVEDCKVTDRTLENNDTWGYIVYLSEENVTRRSAIGLTRDGDLIVAVGVSVQPGTLAAALQAAGACTAMQLDINTPQVNASLYFHAADGSIEATGLTDWTPDPRRFLKTQETDFMYVVLDETTYRP